MLAELFVSTSISLVLKRLSGFTPMPSLTPQVFARAWENPSRTIPVVAEAGEGSDSLTITGICLQSPPLFCGVYLGTLRMESPVVGMGEGAGIFFCGAGGAGRWDAVCKLCSTEWRQEVT